MTAAPLVGHCLEGEQFLKLATTEPSKTLTAGPRINTNGLSVVTLSPGSSPSKVCHAQGHSRTAAQQSPVCSVEAVWDTLHRIMPRICFQLQVSELANASAKQAAVLESDSGHYNYESCRSSCTDTDKVGVSAQSSTRLGTPVAAEGTGSGYSYSLSSMSSEAPSTPAQHPAAEASPASPQGQSAPSGLKNTLNKIFGSSWGSETSSNSPEGGHGLIAAFRAIMPKTSGSQSGSGKLSACCQHVAETRLQHK